MNPAQNRTGSASAPSQPSHAVDPAGRPAAQSASSTLFPAPPRPPTPPPPPPPPAPPVSRPANTPRDTNVDGNPAARNFATANRAPGTARRMVALCVTVVRSPSPGELPAVVLVVLGASCRRDALSHLSIRATGCLKQHPAWVFCPEAEACIVRHGHRWC